MKPSGRLYDNSQESIEKYGKTYMCSNEGTMMKFNPVWFPIKGNYDDYGGIQDIEENDNTRIISEYYGLTIQEVMNVITSGRKDDGYDNALKVIKKPFEYPDGWIKGETHIQFYARTQNDPHPYDGRNPWSVYQGTDKEKFLRHDENNKALYISKEEFTIANELSNAHYKRYEAWKKSNPDPDSDYGNPQYQERYKELVKLSAMWVHGDVYDRLVKKKDSDGYDKLDLGNRQLLEALGFEFVGKDKSKERYDEEFVKDGLSVYSDGTWIHSAGGEGVYTLTDFKKYCKKNGADIEIDEINKWSRVEQIARLVMPTIELPSSEAEIETKIKALKERLKGHSKEDVSDELTDKMFAILDNSNGRIGDNRMNMSVYHILLNGYYSEYQIKNPLSVEYLKAVQEGKMIEEITDFWTFNHFMYCMGAYYEIVGTGPQDGELREVKKVLETALEIVNEEYDEEDYDE